MGGRRAPRGHDGDADAAPKTPIAHAASVLDPWIRLISPKSAIGRACQARLARALSLS